MSCGKCEKAPRNFCQEPSEVYLKLLEEEGGDPRAVAGRVATEDLREQGGWMPTVDARDARRQGSLGKNR